MSDKASNIGTVDQNYKNWIKYISSRFRQSQIKQRLMLMKKCCDFIGTLVMIFISDRVKIVMALTFLEN